MIDISSAVEARQLRKLLEASTTHPVVRLFQQRREAGDAGAMRVRTVEQVQDWLTCEMFIAHDAEALAAYDAHGVQQLGSDPLGGGPFHQWPDALSNVPPGAGLVHATEDDPVIGWRYWTNDGPTLLAPFRSTESRVGPTGPGVIWQPGVNTTEHRDCGQDRDPHPSPVVRCVCGIRVMQSWRSVRRFAAAMDENSRQSTAFAEVALWGRVAGPAAGDDWRYTARGQHARIVGPIQLAASQAEHASAMGQRYGVDVEVDS